MSYLSLEQHIVDRLTAVPGLIVRTTADTSEVALKALGLKPTAVVAFISSDVVESKSKAILSDQTWSVYYVRRGAVSERDAVDGEHLEAIIRALHGWTPDEYEYSPMRLQNVATDYRDNAREYFVTLKSQTTMRL
ncbi:hypothetical protein RugamoR57_37550 [Duganella caerulea]|uniref:phage tail terminator protein n=1 Tax=Duganella caerulea TaxID=2885762 RepID=UPI0030E88D72